MRHKALVMVAVTLILATTAWASSETVIYNLDNYTGDGYQPYSGLVADAKGNLYGTTYYGGTNNVGSVFELTLSGGLWTEQLLYSFAGGTSDGAYPQYSPLVFDKTGHLYGTTSNGGSACNCGIVFELTKSGSTWKETVLHAFLGSAQKDGYVPQAGLSFDTAGNLYGTTEYGGLNNSGTVFQLQPTKSSWKYKTIHQFNSTNGGLYYPIGGITQGPNGYYYGTTYYGGFAYNAGAVYRLFQARGVWVAQAVFFFLEGGDGTNPDSSLTMDSKGNMYGTTYGGGVTENCSQGCGSVYKLTAGSNDTFTQSVIYSFQGQTKDGQNPAYGAGVTLDPTGSLYGTARYGGSSTNAGIAYKLKLVNGAYKETVLHAFTGDPDGYNPLGGVIIVKGKVYGTTYVGGKQNQGTVFEITP
jgi:uncharacterized repeat protein (TIGR03803 family)